MAETKPAPPGEVGRIGLEHWNGVMREEWLTDLQGAQAAKIYQQMRDESPIVGACFGTISALLSQATLRARPYNGSTDTEDQRRAAFVDECLQDLKRGQAGTIASLLSMLTHGWSVHEPVFRLRAGYNRDPDLTSRYSDGLIGWSDWAPRLQRTLDRWDLKSSGSPLGMWQRAAPTYQPVLLPIDRVIHLAADASTGSPEGRSCLRNAYEPWYTGRHIQYILKIGIERDLVGMPVMKVPGTVLSDQALADTKAQYEKLVQSVRRCDSEGVLIPSDVDPETKVALYELSLIASPGQRTIDISKEIERLERRIAMALLADWIFLGHQAEGSYALADSRTSMFAAAIGGWLKILVQGINLQAVPALLAVNGLATDRCPEVYHTDIETPDLGKIGDYISKLYAAHFPFDWANDQPLTDHLRRIAGLPAHAASLARGKATAATTADADPEAA